MIHEISHAGTIKTFKQIMAPIYVYPAKIIGGGALFKN